MVPRAGPPSFASPVQGVLKKEHVEIPGVNEKRRGISSGVQEKIMWNFHRSWFLTLEFPRGVTILQNFQG